MSKLFDNSITIYEAIQNIRDGKYVMPAFQRQYVWSMEQIEKLWDSILLDYPIATFLFWHVDDNNVSWDTYVCNFLTDVTFDSARQADSVNYDLRTIDLRYTDTAILDGQQRLTSLYLSLFGDAVIRPKYSRKKTETGIITKLVIELNKNKLTVDVDEYNSKKFDIKYCDKVGKLSPTQFEIRNILSDKFADDNTRDSAIETAIAAVPENSKDYARNILNQLYRKIFVEKLIRYTEIRDMKQDDALEMFVRFNSGGKALKKSEITMSILEAYWPNAKTEFGKLLVGPYSKFGNEFLIRTALMIYGDVIKSNINAKIADELKNNWSYFKKALNDLVDLFNDMHIDMDRFSTCWNILLPIIYSIYYNPYYKNTIDGIFTYLVRAILFIYFRSGTTGKLHQMKSNINDNNFEITVDMLNQMTEFKVTEGKIDDIINSEKDSRIVNEALYYLSLEWLDSSVKYEVDHLHPYAQFDSRPTGVSIGDWKNWHSNRNRMPNLHLLHGIANAKKLDSPLDIYVNSMTEAQRQEFYEEALIPNDVSLSLSHFGDFYEQRKTLLAQRLRSLLG